MTNEKTMPDLANFKAEAKTLINDAKEAVDDLLYSPEAFAIGVGFFAAGTVGFGMRHLEVPMFLAAEAGDVAEEAASEIGGLTTAVEVGGD